MSFACPSCAAPLGFEGETERLACVACGYGGQSDDAPALTPAAERLSAEALARGATTWGARRLALSCSGCGAKLSLDPAEIARRCAFCGSAAVRPEKDDGGLLPTGLGPFRVDTRAAQTNARAWLARGWMHPSHLAEVSVNQFVGMYLPYWSFSAVGRAPWRAEVGVDHAQRVRGRTIHSIAWHDRRGVVDRAWSNLLIPGTNLVPPTLLVRIEPFDPDLLRPYDPDQLVGWQAHGFDVPLERAWARANARMRADCAAQARGTVAATHLRAFEMRLFLAQEAWAYVLLPVWVSTFHWGGRSWQVLVNGQTGTVEGHRPVVWTRVYAVMGACFLPALLFLALPPLALLLAAFGAVGALWIRQRARRAEGP